MGGFWWRNHRVAEIQSRRGEDGFRRGAPVSAREARGGGPPSAPRPESFAGVRGAGGAFGRGRDRSRPLTKHVPPGTLPPSVEAQCKQKPSPTTCLTRSCGESREETPDDS
jgi:hypothetical protein